MFRQLRQDLEAQTKHAPGLLGDGEGRLRKRVQQKDFRSLRRTVGGKTHADLTQTLFWYQDFGSTTSTTSFEFADVNFGDALKNLGKALTNARKSSLPSLQLCILSTSPVSTDIYSWGRRLLATNLGRLRAIVSFPRYAVALEIEEGWGQMSECSYRSIERPEEMCGIEQLSLPEFRKQWLCHTEVDCKCKFSVPRIINHYDPRPLPRNDAKYGRKMPKEPDSSRVATFSVEIPSKAVEEGRTFADQALSFQCSRIFDRKTASFTFTWQRGAPAYHGGFDTFLWERYSKPPTSDYAEVFYQDDYGLNQPRRVLMTVSVAPLLMSMRSLLGDPKVVSEFMQELSSDSQSTFYTLLPLFLVFEQAITDTAMFIQQASDEIKKIVSLILISHSLSLNTSMMSLETRTLLMNLQSFAGRSDPSVEKIQYLFHLNDCQQSGLFGVEHVHLVTKRILSVIRSRTNDDSPVELKFLEEKETDLVYLIQRLQEPRKQVDEQCSLIKGHRDLEQTRQMSLLTKIATIYVPLSFVTGFLGMQITDPSLFLHHGDNRKSGSTSDQSGASTSTNLAVRQVTSSISSFAVPSAPTAVIQVLESQLAAQISIASNTNNQNAYVWGFGVFLGMAGVFFVLGLLLPLVGPNLLRIVVQRTYKVRSYTVFWPFVFFFYYASVYWMIPEIMQAALGCSGGADVYCEKGYNKYFYIYDFKTSGNDGIDIVTYVLSAVVMGVIGLTQLALAVMYRKGALVTLKWIGFAIVVIAVYLIDYYLSLEEDFMYPIATGLSLYAIVPVVYLLIVWSVPQLLHLWNNHSGPKSK